MEFVRSEDFDGFLAVGGGSVMDTAKVANAFLCHKEAELLDFTNAPVGKGMKIEGPLKPLIAGVCVCVCVCVCLFVYVYVCMRETPAHTVQYIAVLSHSPHYLRHRQ